MSKIITDLKKKFKNIKIEYIIIVLAVIAVIALFYSSFNQNKGVESSKTVEEYVEMLENKLSKNLSKINGAGSVNVIISVKKGLTSEIVTETTTSSNGSSSQKKPVLVSGKPIILSEIYPEITGVVIIAKGADHIRVKMALMSAVQTFLDVTSDKVEILTMK